VGTHFARNAWSGSGVRAMAIHTNCIPLCIRQPGKLIIQKSPDIVKNRGFFGKICDHITAKVSLDDFGYPIQRQRMT
jgi:hypothetical protein